VSSRTHIPAKPTSPPSRNPSSKLLGSLRGRCAYAESGGECEACKKKNVTLQRSDAGAATAPSVQGQPPNQPAGARSEFRFGHDFARVRVHSQAEVAGSTTGSGVLQRQDAGTDAGTHTSGVTGPAGAASTGTAGSAAAATPTLDLKAIRVAFKTSGSLDPHDCTTVPPDALGVGAGGHASNGMEMIFRIDGTIPPGTEFDILRTRTNAAWQQVGGAWTQIHRDPAGTNDDHTNDDECLTPDDTKRIFVIDQPGFPAGDLDPRGAGFFGARVSATATAFVMKFSFAEWVIARNRPSGIDFKAISEPTYTFWHSITSVAQTGGAGGAFAFADTPSGQHNEIALGSISTAGATP
jgi:hypothetical protein